GGGGGEEICLDSVGDVTEITAGGTVAINLDGLAAEHGANPLGNHGGIGAVGVLAGAKDIEVAEAHALQAVGASENAGDIGGVGAEGIFNGAGNGTEGGLMEDIIGAFARAAAEVEIEEIALEKGEARP